MRKKISWLVLLLLISCLQACHKDETKNLKMESYKIHYNMVESYSNFKTKSSYFSTSSEMVKREDGSYVYYIFIDHARVEMNQVVVMAVEKGVPYAQNKKMMPSSGIFDKPSSLIPNQVNKEKGYVKGIVVSGEAKEKKIQVDILVEFKDYTGEIQREFIHLEIQ
ncbi:hypothetical protein [Bulleidia sp. zg-1006]|uniref:hypothetical protein n=1 Tax=Bulleidia sp. zg-1006 TaxID=2806552 RepID=UPI001939EA20|nr:hypothetical protein [Bulleidia sp. zg-1006]QRG86034.1 hypothetical protein JOS54_03950 [Bulleidia sp. zg-1006]